MYPKSLRRDSLFLVILVVCPFLVILDICLVLVILDTSPLSNFVSLLSNFGYVSS